MSTEVECSCGHQWATRKPLGEIDQLRCSECGTADDEDLTVPAEDEDDEPAPTEPDIIDEVEAKARREDLLERIEKLIDRCEVTDPPDSGHRVAADVRSEYRRLEALLERLLSDESFGVAELEELEEFVDDLADHIDQHAEEIERIDRLEDVIAEREDQVSELSSTRSDLESTVDGLENRIGELEKRRDELKRRLGDLEDAKDKLQRGYEAGKKDYRITIPCTFCGEEMEMEPESDLHYAAIDELQYQGWGHNRCREDRQTR